MPEASQGKAIWARLRDALRSPAANDSQSAPGSGTAQKLIETMSEDELRRILSTRGFDLVKRHYYSPIPDSADFGSEDFWNQTTELPGVDMGEQAGLDVVRKVLPPFLEEFRARFPLHADQANGGFFLINGVYMAVDAHLYYGLVRHLKPKRIIEIGSGQSTRIALEALEVNRSEDGEAGHVTAIEPYPNPQLKELAGSGKLTLREAKVQDLGTSVFEELHSGDILFIDSTHVLREGNDVQFEYLEVLPRLPAGVYVHVHDISLPRRYPKAYFDQGLYWNEQYLLQAFLAFNQRFEVIWAGNHLLLRHPDVMFSAFPEINDMRKRWPQSEPSAFWMRAKMGA